MQDTTDHDVARGASVVQRLAIDDAFDVAFAGEIARLESYNKHHYRPNSYLHKWWARRCGSTFRLILKHLVTDEARRDYYAPGGLEGKVVLDPMMGGGTTLHEAIRMGANVVGIDVDPIPVLQARASLAELSLRDMERAFRGFYKGLNEKLGSLWLTRCRTCDREGPLRFVLYGARRHCECGPALVVDSLVLRYEGGRVAFHICPRCHDVVEGAEPCTCRGRQGVPVVERDTSCCPDCKQDYRQSLEPPFYARYAPLAIAGQCEAHGLFFVSPREEDMQRMAAAEEQRCTVLQALGDGFAVEPGPKARDLLSHGVCDYRDLFSSRQLLYLSAAREGLREVAEPARLKLALLVSTSLEFNAMLCGYKGRPKRAGGARPGAIRHAFAHHAYSFPTMALENNVLYPAKSSGTLQKLFHDRVRRAQRWARAPQERQLHDGASNDSRFVHIEGERDTGHEVHTAAALQNERQAFLVRQGTAAALPLPDNSVDYVVTDPPYYDNVQYSDLAAFFRVWLPGLLSDERGERYEWRYDLREVAVDALQNGNGQYGYVLGKIFRECRRVLKDDGRLIFTFHHWKPQSWAALTLALQKADFRLVNRYVVHAENPISVHVANLRAITDDAILVLAPGSAGAQRLWQRPDRVNVHDSADFCRDCATLLGWMLQEGLAASAVKAMWREALATG